MIRDNPDNDDEVERDGVGGAGGRGQKEDVVIDLTQSSDDEEVGEEERPSRRKRAR